MTGNLLNIYTWFSTLNIQKGEKNKKNNFSLRGKIFNGSTFFVLHKEMFNQDSSGYSQTAKLQKTNVRAQLCKQDLPQNATVCRVCLYFSVFIVSQIFSKA